MERMEESVWDYVNEHPNADYSAIVIRFGTPQQIAASCVAEMDEPELTKQLRARREIVGIVGVTALTVVLLWAGVVLTALAKHSGDVNGYFVERIVEVERVTSEGGK